MFDGEWLWSRDLLLKDRVQVGQFVRMWWSVVLHTDVRGLASGLILDGHSNGPRFTDGRLSWSLHWGWHEDRGELKKKELVVSYFN